jgi:hypothetical protein
MITMEDKAREMDKFTLVVARHRAIFFILRPTKVV